MIDIQNLSKSYNHGKSNEIEVLHNLNFTIPDHALVAIVGKSGSGKSTLLHLIALIDRFQKGDIHIEGESIKKYSEKKLAHMRNQKIGLVLQDFALIPDYSVLENVMLPFCFSEKRIKDAKERALQALEQTEIKELAEKQASQLSGGQKQRVGIARAIVNHPSILLADEPTGALDSKTSENIMTLFKKIHSTGTTVIIVTHDNEIASNCDSLIRITDGIVAETRRL